MKKVVSVIGGAVAIALLFTSCGAGVKSAGDYNYFDAVDSNASYGWDAGADWATDEVAEEWDVEAPAPAEAAPEANAAQSSRKIIKNGDLSIETLEYDKFVYQLETSVSSFGGYIESSSHYGRDSNRSANYTVRVPENSYEAFMDTVGGLGTVISSSTSTDDVTLKYVDVEARLAAYKAERDSFMELLEKAETVEDILRIQEYLTDVNYQIESYTSQLNTMKDLVSYSAVRINVSEVERVTPPAPKTVWERISTKLDENLYDISEGAKNFFVNFVSSIPYIVIYAVIIGIIAAVIIIIVKKNRKKQLKAIEDFAKNNPPQEQDK